MKCGNPRCQAPLEPGDRVCPFCGTRVEIADAPERAPEAPKSAPDASESVPPAAEVTKRVPHVPFELAAALPKAMQVGRRSTVKVRFRAIDDIYESVEFVLRCGSKELSRAGCCVGRPGVAEHLVPLPVTPGTCGEARLALDVVCCVKKCEKSDDGKREMLPDYFETHTVDMDMHVDAQSPTSFAPVININQNNTSDRAGDTKGGDIHLNLGGLPLSQPTDPSRYETSTSFSPLAVRLAASPARLTLMCGDEALQLVSDDRVTFGRDRTATIPLRICGPDGMVDYEANRFGQPDSLGRRSYVLSRLHFEIKRTGGDCVVSDGANGRPSSTGTRVDASPLPPCGAVKLVPRRETALEAGCEEKALRMRVTFHRDAWGRAEGFVLSRQDGARQRVCAVWRDVPLGDGESVFWSGILWQLSAGGKPPIPLVVGTAVTIEGKSFLVLPFRQTHVR